MESCIFSPWAGYYEDPEGTCYLFFYYVRTYVIVFRGGSRIFERGGGSRRGYRIFHKHPPPWTLSAWRHPLSENLKNTPTFGHSQAPPSLDIVRVTSSTFQGGRGYHPCHTHTLDPPLGSILGLQAKKGGSNFGSNVKKPTSWPKGGGGPDIIHLYTGYMVYMIEYDMYERPI